ncbi:MAG: 4Fe-4S cluster-binding domain-containing protein, partial [Spirochaetales bacterium]|nr:4Fe-4S cluster-binding domain-containing protein [Spirochaetales bacterium]
MEMIHPLKAFSLFVTEECNLDCTYCFFTRKDKREITLTTARRAVDFFLAQSKNENSLQLSFWGGEPLLSLGLLRKIVDYATWAGESAGKKIRYSMPTN